jgi:hypothetical protein
VSFALTSRSSSRTQIAFSAGPSHAAKGRKPNDSGLTVRHPNSDPRRVSPDHVNRELTLLLVASPAPLVNFASASCPIGITTAKCGHVDLRRRSSTQRRSERRRRALHRLVLLEYWKAVAAQRETEAQQALKDARARHEKFRGQSSLGWVFLGRKVHFTESRNLPSASQSSTVNSTINALLSPRHTLHAGQPVSRSS